MTTDRFAAMMEATIKTGFPRPDLVFECLYGDPAKAVKEYLRSRGCCTMTTDREREAWKQVRLSLLGDLRDDGMPLTKAAAEQLEALMRENEALREQLRVAKLGTLRRSE